MNYIQIFYIFFFSPSPASFDEHDLLFAFEHYRVPNLARLFRDPSGFSADCPNKSWRRMKLFGR